MAELHYRAGSRYTYASALLALVELAREHTGKEFRFGPLSLDQIESSGLVVSGPGREAARERLSRVPGLAESEE